MYKLFLNLFFILFCFYPAYASEKIPSQKLSIYQNNKVIGERHDSVVGNSRYLSYYYYKGIDAQLIMYNKKSYRLNYIKKVEKYVNGLLNRVSYYEKNGNKNQKNPRLRVKIFYADQVISGYKIRRYNTKGLLSKEEYYSQDSRWINIYDKLGKLILSYYYPPGEKKGYFSKYTYNKSRQLTEKKDFRPNKKKYKTWYFRENGSLEKIEFYKNDANNLLEHIENYDSNSNLSEITQYDRLGDKILED